MAALSTRFEPPVAFVLGGGGSLGAMQVGMLEALSEHGIVPDLVVGTSVGAINGAVVAADPAGAAHRLSHIWSRLDTDRVFPHRVIQPVQSLLTHRGSVFSESGLGRVLSAVLAGHDTFDDLALPLHVVTTDVASGLPLVISTGPLVPALLASAAIPGVFPPVERDGRLLCDGGLVANVPLQQAVAAGARSLVVLDCTFPGHAPIPPGTLAETMLFAATVVLRSQSSGTLASLPPDITLLRIPGPAPAPVWPLGFHDTLALIDASYEAARAFLAGAGTGSAAA